MLNKLVLSKENYDQLKMHVIWMSGMPSNVSSEVGDRFFENMSDYRDNLISSPILDKYLEDEEKYIIAVEYDESDDELILVVSEDGETQEFVTLISMDQSSYDEMITKLMNHYEELETDSLLNFIHTTLSEKSEQELMQLIVDEGLNE